MFHRILDAIRSWLTSHPTPEEVLRHQCLMAHRKLAYEYGYPPDFAPYTVRDDGGFSVSVRTLGGREGVTVFSFSPPTPSHSVKTGQLSPATWTVTVSRSPEDMYPPSLTEIGRMSFFLGNLRFLKMLNEDDIRGIWGQFFPLFRREDLYFRINRRNSIDPPTVVEACDLILKYLDGKLLLPS